MKKLAALLAASTLVLGVGSAMASTPVTPIGPIPASHIIPGVPAPLNPIAPIPASHLIPGVPSPLSPIPHG